MQQPRLTGIFVGLATLDVVQRVERLPGPDEKIVAVAADVASGGPATNAAVTFAALGGSATLVTALGAGPVRLVVLDDLTRHHVDVVDAGAPGYAGPAISAVSIVTGTGERSVVSRNAEQAGTVVPAHLSQLISGAGVVLIDGHLPGLARAAVDAARPARARVVYDGGSWKPAVADVLSCVDAAVCSADFAVPGSSGIEESAHAMLTAGVTFVAFTDGPQPIRWWTNHGSGAIEVRPVIARDTLGAGDAFHGAFGFAIAGGADPTDALRFAADVTAVRVEHVGPRAWLSDPRLQTLAGRIGN